MTRGQALTVGGVVILIALVAAFEMHRGSAVRYFSEPVQRGDVRDAVDATGTANAVLTVQVGSQVSGTISKLYVDFNSHVHKGELVARIDPSLLQGALLQATADLESAKANRSAARANVDRARAGMVQTRADYERGRALLQEHLETQQVVDAAKASYDAATASVAAAVANVAQANAQVSQKAAAVAVAQTNLAHTVIRSPIDGVVVARNVAVGQTVAASLQAPTIFTIAQDLARMQLYALMDESDVGRIKVGQAVTFKVDAYPKDTFTGVISQIRMNATTIQNVVTYDAIIDFANPQLKIFPGMTAFVTIPVATVTNVVKVPNSALRYTPPLTEAQLAAAYGRAGIRHPPAHGQQGRGENALVWKRLAGGTVEPVEISLGITDHAFTQVTRVLAGSLAPGDEVVTGSVSSGGQTSGPGAPGGR